MLISHPVDDPNRYYIQSAIHLNHVPGSINFKEREEKIPLNPSADEKDDTRYVQ